MRLRECEGRSQPSFDDQDPSTAPSHGVVCDSRRTISRNLGQPVSHLPVAVGGDAMGGGSGVVDPPSGGDTAVTCGCCAANRDPCKLLILLEPASGLEPLTC